MSKLTAGKIAAFLSAIAGIDDPLDASKGGAYKKVNDYRCDNPTCDLAFCKQSSEHYKNLRAFLDEQYPTLSDKTKDTLTEYYISKELELTKDVIVNAGMLSGQIPSDPAKTALIQNLIDLKPN